MATDLTDVVKQGYIRCKSRSLGLWQKRWIVLRSSSNKGPCRLEKYLNEYSARNLEQHKVQLLTNVVSVDRLQSNQKRHAFQIDFNDGSSKYFACDSDLEADNWVKLTIQECFLPTSGIANGEPDVLKPGIQKELQEQFKVYLMPSSKLDVFGECLLQVTHENIYLWDSINTKVKLCAWPLTALRRYGSDLTKFTFEAGRHCATGEGMFIFHTLEGEKIYRKVHQATLAIAEAHQRMKKQQQQQQQQQQQSDLTSLSTNTTTLSSATTTKTTSKNNLENYSGSNTREQQLLMINNEQRISWYNSPSSTEDNDNLVNTLQSQVYNHQSLTHFHHQNVALGLEV